MWDLIVSVPGHCLSFYSPVLFTCVHSIHKSEICKQERSLFTGSYVHTSISVVYAMHRCSNIIQVKHHVNWFTSRSSTCISRLHL